MKNERMIGLLGAGYWGKNILRNLHELNVLHTVCETSRPIVESFMERYPDLKFTLSVEEIMGDPDIKAVAIATPASTHHALVKKAILSGKDVFVEKPLSLTVQEAEELVRLADEHGRILMVGHILHYHPAVRKLKEIISGGEIGKIQYIYSNRLNIGKIRTEENILWSFAPHDISLILSLTGEQPERVIAFGGDYVNEGIYDTTVSLYEFPSGVRAHIFVSWLHPYKEQKLIIVGTRAMLVFDDVSREKLFLYRHTIQWKDGKIPVASKAEYETVEIEQEEPLRNELLHFMECIRERKRPLTDGKEGLRVLSVLALSERSLSMGGQPVSVSVAAEDYFVHESSFVDESVEIGKGTKVWHFSHILKNTKIGENCIVGQNVMIGPDVIIGNRCKIQNNVSVYKGVTLEDEVFVGPSAVFTNVYNPRAFIERKHEFKDTLVRRGATIGANATIVCGVTIGRYAMVGAGAVVKSDVPDYAIVAGVPARQIGWACKCGVSLRVKDSNAICEHCGNEYRIGKEGLMPEKEA